MVDVLIKILTVIQERQKKKGQCGNVDCIDCPTEFIPCIVTKSNDRCYTDAGPWKKEISPGYIDKSTPWKVPKYCYYNNGPNLTRIDGQLGGKPQQLCLDKPTAVLHKPSNTPIPEYYKADYSNIKQGPYFKYDLSFNPVIKADAGFQSTENKDTLLPIKTKCGVLKDICGRKKVPCPYFGQTQMDETKWRRDLMEPHYKYMERSERMTYIPPSDSN